MYILPYPCQSISISFLIWNTLFPFEALSFYLSVSFVYLHQSFPILFTYPRQSLLILRLSTPIFFYPSRNQLPRQSFLIPTFLSISTLCVIISIFFYLSWSIIPSLSISILIFLSISILNLIISILFYRFYNLH